MQYFKRNVAGVVRTAYVLLGDNPAALIDVLNSAKLSEKQRELLLSVNLNPDELSDVKNSIGSAVLLQSLFEKEGPW